MSSHLEEEVAVDESKFHHTLGVFISSEVMTTPYTTTERKLLKLMREHSDLLPEEDQSYLYFNHYIFPNLIAATFGTIATFCVWGLDNAVMKQRTKESQSQTQSEAEPEQRSGDLRKTSEQYNVKDDPLQEMNLLHKRRRGKAAAQKYDYMKAAQEMSKNSVSENVSGYQLRFKGYKRYFIVFSSFCFLGSIHGFCRSRMNLYWFSKKYEGKLNDVSGAVQKGGSTSIGPLSKTSHADPQTIEKIKKAEAEAD